VGDRGEQRERRLARVETGVLDDDRDVGLDQRRIIRVTRDRLRVLEIVEAQMQQAVSWLPSSGPSPVLSEGM
jgi:hypothetical protein